MQTYITNIFLYCLFLFAIIIIAFIGWKAENKDKEEGKLNEFYFGKKSIRKNSLQYIKYGELKQFGIILFWAVFLGGYSIIIKYTVPNSLWAGTGEYVDSLPVIMLTSFFAVMTFVSLIVSTNKKNYITYKIEDIIEKYSLRNKFFRMLLYLVGSFVLQFFCVLLKNTVIPYFFFTLKSLIVYSFVCFFFELAYIMFFFIQIMLGTNVECKMLKSLHQEFWYKEVKKDKRRWDKDGVNECTQYLFEEYEKSMNKIPYESIENIRFDTTLRLDNKENKRMAKKSIFIIFLFINFFSVIEGLMNFIFNKEIEWSYWGFIIVQVIISCIIGSVFYNIKSLAKVSIIITNDRKGYFITLKNKMISHIYATEIQFNVNCKWRKYLLSCKNILAFYKIALLREPLDAQYIVEIIEKNIIEKSDDEQNKLKVILFLMEYLWYEVYEEYYLSNAWLIKKTDIEYKIMKAIISDINNKTSNKYNLMTPKLDKYIENKIRSQHIID